MTGPRGRHPDELISASLSGDLTDAERAELDWHLAVCATCRSTLDAFRAERDLLTGMREVEPPRDLHARVRAGIEGAASPQPWWRSWPGTAAASLVTVAAAAALVLVISRFPFGPVGSASPVPSGSASLAPSASAEPTPTESAEPSVPGDVALRPGQVGYLSLVGAPFEEARLYFVNDATGASVEAQAPSGPVLAAALSPGGEWLAYITQKGESGANETWVLRIADGTTILLGCSLAGPFTDRLAWSLDGAYLAYTLTAVDLGDASGCPANDAEARTTDAWLFDPATGEHYRITGTGDAYAAAFTHDTQPTLLVSHAAATPWTEAVPLFADPVSPERFDGIFLPLLSPDGDRALFWRGTMAAQPEGWAWSFASGGMPYASGSFLRDGPAESFAAAEPLFADAADPQAGLAMASAGMAWGASSDLVVLWSPAWNGAPEGGGAPYLDAAGVYAGRVSSGGLTVESRLEIGTDQDGWVVDARFTLDGESLLVTVALPSAGIGDPPSARLWRVPLHGGDPVELGGGGDPPPWNGPAVIGR